jgi:hypothetical protein
MNLFGGDFWLEKILNPFGDSDLNLFCALSLTPLRTEPTSLRKKKRKRRDKEQRPKQKEKGYGH